MHFIAVRQVIRKKYSRARQTELTFFKFCGTFYSFDCLSAFIAIQYGTLDHVNDQLQGDDSHRLL